MLAWSPAALALSTADAACNARADAPATRASALRSVAVASSSSCAVADRLACRPAMRSWDARARARPASAARSSAAAAFDPLFGGKGRCARGTGAGGEIVAVEHDERLAFADPIAWRHADLAHRRQDARRDRGRGASLHHAARVDRTGHVGHRNLGDGDGDGLCRVGRSGRRPGEPSIRPAPRSSRVLPQRPQR